MFNQTYFIVNIDETYLDRIHINIISDGIDHLDSETYLKRLERVGIFNEEYIREFKTVRIKDGNKGYEEYYHPLWFINEKNMNSKERHYGANNLIHCFSKYMHFEEWLNGLDEDKRDEMKINHYSIPDFLLGNDKPKKVRQKIFKHLKMPINFMIKHRNQGKIESHKWFYKGFCGYTNPVFIQVLDCGSIPLWNSISKIIMHME